MLSPHREHDFAIKTIEALSSPIAPAARNRVSYPARVTDNSVELSFSFGIASMQMTPTFQIGALQLRPLSKVVTMRLPPAQRLQSAVHLQMTWEIARFQPTLGEFGIVKLAPSQRQRPTIGQPLFFGVAGLERVSNFEAAPLHVTPSQEASVVVTGDFQIASVEFSPSFELGSIVLNSSAKDVAVQLPGAESVEAGVKFEIVHVQLGSSGEIGMMQLNLLDERPMRSPQVYNTPRIANTIETERLENALALCNILKPAANGSVDEDSKPEFGGCTPVELIEDLETSQLRWPMLLKAAHSPKSPEQVAIPL